MDTKKAATTTATPSDAKVINFRGNSKHLESFLSVVRRNIEDLPESVFCEKMASLQIAADRIFAEPNTTQSKLDDAVISEFDKAEEKDDDAKWEIDLSQEYPSPNYILVQERTGTLPRGDIQAIKAKSKNGKSFLCSVLIASIFGCRDFGFYTTATDPVVCFFDTEQNARNTATLASRVHALMHWPTAQSHPSFHAYALREMDADRRYEFIERKVDELKPTAIFIDGVADLIPNFNDVEQSSHIINQLMKLSSEHDCAVVCVLHTNKAKDDNGMKGHLGTLLLQKASDVWEVKKSADTFCVSETDSRNQPTEDFAFTLDDKGIPRPTANAAALRGKMKAAKLRDNFAKAFGHEQELPYNELADRYSEVMDVCKSTAQKHIKEAKEMGIFSFETGRYKLV